MNGALVAPQVYADQAEMDAIAAANLYTDGVAANLQSQVDVNRAVLDEAFDILKSLLIIVELQLPLTLWVVVVLNSKHNNIFRGNLLVHNVNIYAILAVILQVLSSCIS